MELYRLFLVFIFVVPSYCFVLNSESSPSFNESVSSSGLISLSDESQAAEVFNGVYSECFLYFSFPCIQKKTLLYIQKLNELSEIKVFGDFVKFIKTNTTESNQMKNEDLYSEPGKLSLKIDRSIDDFFDSHVIRFRALGKDISLPRTVDEFVGRKKRKGGGGGGGGGHHGGGDGDDGGKKKMMMMAMMCMKMKFMMMVPAMMGMMGMMSFKGMMFSMMSFMMSKMMLLMKIMEKKGMGGGGDASGWAAGGGGGGAWMPAGGQDYGGGGGGGGGYDANGQWQSRSIPEANLRYNEDFTNYTPEISYVKPVVSFNNVLSSKKALSSKNEFENEVSKSNDNENYYDQEGSMKRVFDTKAENTSKSRRRRGIMDLIQNAYIYWINRILGFRRYNKMNPLHQQQKYRIINGVKYVYYPMKYVNKVKHITQATQSPEIITIKPEDGFKPITIEDFNKGEIVDRPAESRMNKRKYEKLKDTVNNIVDDNPWE